MAHKTVQLIIAGTLTDDAFRDRFVADPGETLSALRKMGHDLTRLDIDARPKTNCQSWQQVRIGSPPGYSDAPSRHGRAEQRKASDPGTGQYEIRMWDPTLRSWTHVRHTDVCGN